jgi:hypothetical protein
MMDCDLVPTKRSSASSISSFVLGTSSLAYVLFRGVDDLIEALCDRTPASRRASGCGILRRWLRFELADDGGGSEERSPRRWSQAWLRCC